MNRQRPLFEVALSVALLLCPLTAMAQETAGPDPNPIKVIVWSDGRWIYVEMIEERYGSIVYQKPGGRPIAAKEHSLDKKTTIEVNQAFANFFDACAGSTQDLGRMFELKGRSRKLFYSIASRQSNDCFQRLYHQYQERLKSGDGERSPSGGRISEVAGQMTLNKPEGSSAATISDQTVSRQLTIEEYETTFFRGKDNFDQATETFFKAAGKVNSASDLVSDEWQSEMLAACDRVEKMAQPLFHIRPPDLFLAVHNEYMKGISDWLSATRATRDGVTNLDPTRTADATRFIESANQHLHRATLLVQQEVATIESTIREDADMDDDLIESYCRERWAEDYSMQARCVEQQKNGALEISRRTPERVGVPKDAFESLRAYCEDRWPRDYNMQDYCEKSQIEGFKKMNR